MAVKITRLVNCGATLHGSVATLLQRNQSVTIAVVRNIAVPRSTSVCRSPVSTGSKRLNVLLWVFVRWPINIIWLPTCRSGACSSTAVQHVSFFRCCLRSNVCSCCVRLVNVLQCFGSVLVRHCAELVFGQSKLRTFWTICKSNAAYVTVYVMTSLQLELVSPQDASVMRLQLGRLRFEIFMALSIQLMSELGSWANSWYGKTRKWSESVPTVFKSFEIT